MSPEDQQTELDRITADTQIFRAHAKIIDPMVGMDVAKYRDPLLDMTSWSPPKVEPFSWCTPGEWANQTEEMETDFYAKPKDPVIEVDYSAIQPKTSLPQYDDYLNATHEQAAESKTISGPILNYESPHKLWFIQRGRKNRPRQGMEESANLTQSPDPFGPPQHVRVINDGSKKQGGMPPAPTENQWVRQTTEDRMGDEQPHEGKGEKPHFQKL